MTFTNITDKTMTKILVIKQFIDWTISLQQAIKKLNKSERTIYRYKKAFIEHWYKWLIHWLTWKPSNNKIYKTDKLKKFALKKKYSWFWPTLLAEELEKELGWWKINPESLRLAMIRWWIRVPKKRKVRKQKRTRRQYHWELVQFDWSYHNWFEDWIERCLLLAIDDATSQIKLAKFSKWESLEDIIDFWKEYFELFWKPSAIYLDKHATYKVNNNNLDMFDEEKLTRFSQAMRKLWVLVIYANTPEAKWRVERSFRTHQDRLVKKLRLAWIKSVPKANSYLKDVYIPEHNKKYSIKAVSDKDLHVPLSNQEKTNFYWYFAKESTRKIRRDGTVHYNNKVYQIKKWEQLYDWYKVTVLESPKWEIEIYSWKVKLPIVKVFNKS